MPTPLRHYLVLASLLYFCLLPSPAAGEEAVQEGAGETHSGSAVGEWWLRE